MRKFFALLLALPLLAAAQGEYDYHYWFDSQLDGPLSASGRSNTPTLTLSPDVSSLREGIHTFNISVADPSGGGVSSIRSNYFLRLPLAGSQTYSVQTLVDGQPYRTDRVTSTGMTLHYDLDATALPYGLHSLSLAVINESGAVSSFHESMFFRVPTDAENSAMVLHYMIDGQEAGTAPLSGGSAMLQLDLVSIPCGVHELTVYASDGRELTTNFASRLFVKTPGPIESYTYWLNGDYSSAKSVKLAEPKADLRVIDMLAVDAVPFRTKMFACVPDAATGNLTLYARNELSVAFFSHSYETVAMDSRSYTDQRVSRTVDASEIHPLPVGYNLSQPLTTPTENSIIWHSFDAEPGYVFNIRCSQNCQIDIFAPDGTPVLNIESAQSTVQHSVNPEQSGRYYVALHDFAGKVKSSQCIYTYLPTRAVADVSPKEMANKGIHFVTIHGNGFNELKKLTLKRDGQEIPNSHIEITDNSEAIVRFDLENLPIGKYSIESELVDSTGTMHHYTLTDIVDVQKAQKGDIEVWYFPEYRNTTPRIVNIEIRNKGNVPYYYIPFNIAARKRDGKCTLSFMNFNAIGLNDEAPEIYYSDNLLGFGVPGAMYAGLIPYLGSNETKVIKIGIDASETYWMYAWCGEPWSEDYEKIMNNDWQFDDYDFMQSNMLSFNKVFLMSAASKYAESMGIDLKKVVRRRPAGTAPNTTRPQPAQTFNFGNDELYNLLRAAIDLCVRNTALEKPVQIAGTLVDMAHAGGQMYGGYVNMLQLRNLDAQMEACGLDPNDPNGADGQFYYLYEARDRIRGRIPSPLSIVATATGDPALGAMAELYMSHAASCQNPRPTGLTNDVGHAIDPNDIFGYRDPSGGTYVGIGVTELPYTIEFENDPELATASALTIDVTNQLDGSVFDLSTFKATELNIGGKTMELPADHEFIRTLDLRPEINAVAQLEMTYDATSGKSRWHLTSLDPMTMEPTDYFEQGILPVNDSISHRGEGMISYTIGLKPGLADGTKLRNQASIVFDTNAPIETPVWENIIDYTLPTAQVAVATADNKEFAFTFSGSDSGAGIWMYALYLRYPGTDEWLLLRDGIEQADFSYEAPEALPAGTMFAVLATDGAGNEQDSAFMRLQPGDVDRSGIVDANDVLALSAYYMGKPVNIALSVSDVNSDGLIDSQDVLAIARIYLQKYPTKKQQRTRKYSTK